MGFSLQPVRFVNSRTVGSYVQLELPFGKNQSAVSFRIHYLEEGTGEPLVLIHSAGQSLYTWNKLIGELSAHFRVIAVDLPGHGYSDASPFCSYSIDEQATVLGIFLSKLGITSAHFIGFSMSCAVIAALYKNNPKRVGRVVFISPGGITPLMPTPVRMLDSRVFGFVGSMLLGAGTIRHTLEECFLDLTIINETMVSQYVEPLMSPDCKRAVRCMVQSYDEDEVLQNFSAMETPVLLLTSSDDRWRNPDCIQPYFDALKPEIRSSAVIRNAGHIMHEEKPEKVLLSILGFIAPKKEEEKAEDNKEKKEAETL